MKKLLLIIIILILAGCSTLSNTMHSETSSAAELEEKETNYKSIFLSDIELEGITAKVEKQEASVIDVELLQFTYAHMKKALFNDKEVYLEDDSTDHLIATDNATCHYSNSVSNSEMHYKTNNIEDVVTILEWKSNNFKDISQFPDDITFPFADRETAITQIKEIINILGINNTGEPIVYSLDYLNLESIGKDIYNLGYSNNEQLYEQWGSQDNYYLIIIECVIDELSVILHKTISQYDDIVMPGSRVVAIYSQNGIEYLEIVNFYTPETIHASSKIVSANDAIDTLAAKFESIITNNQFEIKDINLKYIPQYVDKSHETLQLVPTWCFTVKEVSTSNNKDSEQEASNLYLINAFTGKEM